MQDVLCVTLDESDLIDALRPSARPRRLAALLLLLALMLAILILVLLVRYPEAQAAFMHSRSVIALTGAVLLAATLVSALLIAAPALRRRAARSMLNDHPGMCDPIRYAFDAEDFSVRTTYTCANYPWSELWDWRENDRVLIIMPTPRNFYVLPKRNVDPAALERLRGHMSRCRKRATQA